jgi:hypothetical protein
MRQDGAGQSEETSCGAHDAGGPVRDQGEARGIRRQGGGDRPACRAGTAVMAARREGFD